MKEPNLITKEEEKSPEQKFCEHVEEWDKKGIPHSMSDLRRLAGKYGTEIPVFKDGELIWKNKLTPTKKEEL